MNQLDFSYNASFASQNVAKVMMKKNELPYSSNYSAITLHH